MARRSDKSKLRKSLQRSHRIEELAAAYYTRTKLDPTEAMLVTQEVKTEAGDLIGINYWLEKRQDSQQVDFLLNVTRGLYRAMIDSNDEALNAGLKLIGDFYERLDDPTSNNAPTTAAETNISKEAP